MSISNSYKNSYKDSDLMFDYIRDNEPHPDAYKPHIHNYYELYCFVSGDAEYMVEGNIYPLVPNTILIMRPGELHMVKLKSSKPYTRYVFCFTDKLMNTVGGSAPLLIPFNDRVAGKFNMYTPERFRGVLPIDLLSAIGSSDLTGEHTRMRIICHLLMILERIHGAFITEKANKPNESPIAEVIEYINTHLNCNLSQAELCRRFYMSDSHMNTLFKRSANMPIGEYITSKRMCLAKMLLGSGMSASDVGAACGYNDYSAFYRAYKKAFGESPSNRKPQKHGQEKK